MRFVMRVVNIHERFLWSGRRHHTLKVENEEIGHVEWTWMNVRVARASLNGIQYSIQGNFLAFCGFGEWTLCDANDVGLLIATRQRFFSSSYAIRQSGASDSESGGELKAFLNNDQGTFFSICPKKSLRCPLDNNEAEVASFQCTRIKWMMKGLAEMTTEGVADDLFILASFLAALQWRTRSGSIVVVVVAAISITWNIVARVILTRLD